MGFPVERTRYRLTFAQEHLQGLEVQVAAMSVREAFAYDDAIADADGMAAIMRVNIETLARQLDHWNLEKSPGEPWPMTLDGLYDLDGHLLGAIVGGWLQALQPAREAVDPTRPDPIEASLPMQPIGDESASGPEPSG